MPYNMSIFKTKIWGFYHFCSLVCLIPVNKWWTHIIYFLVFLKITFFSNKLYEFWSSLEECSVFSNGLNFLNFKLGRAFLLKGNAVLSYSNNICSRTSRLLLARPWVVDWYWWTIAVWPCQTWQKSIDIPSNHLGPWMLLSYLQSVESIKCSFSQYNLRNLSWAKPSWHFQQDTLESSIKQKKKNKKNKRFVLDSISSIMSKLWTSTYGGC